jgi:hypothetical protein
MTDTAIQRITDTPIVYSVTDEALKSLEEKWTEIPDCSDKKNYEVVRKGISEVVGLRTSVEKRRKELKADSLEYGRRVDSAAKSIKDRLVAIETPLKAAKGKVDDAKRLEKERKAKIEKDRVDGILAKITAIRDKGVANWDETAADIAKRCAVQDERLEEIVKYISEYTETEGVAKALTMSIVHGEVPWVEYVG